MRTQFIGVMSVVFCLARDETPCVPACTEVFSQCVKIISSARSWYGMHGLGLAREGRKDNRHAFFVLAV